MWGVEKGVEDVLGDCEIGVGGRTSKSAFAFQLSKILQKDELKCWLISIRWVINLCGYY